MLELRPEVMMNESVRHAIQEKSKASWDVTGLVGESPLLIAYAKGPAEISVRFYVMPNLLGTDVGNSSFFGSSCFLVWSAMSATSVKEWLGTSLSSGT